MRRVKEEGSCVDPGAIGGRIGPRDGRAMRAFKCSKTPFDLLLCPYIEVALP